jgi:hypothetical protein
MSKIDTFLKSWLTMVDSEAAVAGFGVFNVLRSEWLPESPSIDKIENAVDVLHGCSVHLPRLMVSEDFCPRRTCHSDEYDSGAWTDHGISTRLLSYMSNTDRPMANWREFASSRS